MRVTFCGHRTITNVSAEQKLSRIVEILMEEGATEFFLGGYGEFDLLCASVVRRLKKKYPQIKTYLIVPYMNRGYDANLYDGAIYPPLETVPLRFAISRRNEWMVEQSDVVVSGVIHNWGGAAKTLAFAKRKGKRVVQI